MEYAHFTEGWLRRAERPNDVKLDYGDRFISLWIAFNGWLKKEYGEALFDKDLIDAVKNNDQMVKTFNILKSDYKEFITNFSKLKWYNVMDMRYNNSQAINCRTKEDFGEYIAVIYRVRCNLFHGRKNISDSKDDYNLVVLAYKTLLPLFKEYLRENPMF